MACQLRTVTPLESWITPAERERGGYADTVREIGHQPSTWEQTRADVIARADALRSLLLRDDQASPRSIVLTGSGSSLYVAECLAPSLQARLGVVARPVAAAMLLTDIHGCIKADDHALVVSFARSGDSPESTAVLDLVLERFPTCRHLTITCNRFGRLATAYVGDPRVMTIVLDPRTNDRSLVMTSSFTNMLVAGQLLGSLDDLAGYEQSVERLAMIARDLLAHPAGELARIARLPFRSVCFLGTGSRLGAAREGALKMLEMSGGEVGTLAETPLGLRHGPMAAVRDDTLVVAGIPASPLARGYAIDVLHEIRRKRPGARMAVVSDTLPGGLMSDGDAAIVLPGLTGVDDGAAAVIDAVVGQILALFRCLAGGLRPDGPSPDGIINRVVPEFRIYR
jgi:tagatose-6-phosphate ketose/aldose isomerase